MREAYWTSKDVSAFLGLGRNAPSVLVRAGRLTASKIGRRLRYDPADVRSFAERCRVNVSAAAEAPVTLLPVAGLRRAP
jgi:hypothetical protein